jgi:uncharacterized membrane protein
MSVAELRPPRSLWRAIHRLEQDERLDAATRAVDEGARIVARGGIGSILRGEWLGHALHPLLSDLPLGCWTAAAVLDLTTWRRGNLAAQRLVGTGLLLAAPTAATGLAEFDALRDQRSRRVALVHATGNAVAIALYFASWRARRHGHHLVGKAASMLGGMVAIGAGHLGGHLSFVLGAGSGERDGRTAAIALPEHAGADQRSPRDLGDAPTYAHAGTSDNWPTIEVVTPVMTEDQRRALRQLPHCMVESGSTRSAATADEVHTAFHFAPEELTVDNLSALSAEAARIAGAARLLYREDDPDVMRLVERVNAG